MIIEGNAETDQSEARMRAVLDQIYAEADATRGNRSRPTLIGGTALRFAYGLLRPSTDLDFAVADGTEMRRINATVRRAVARLAAVAQDAVTTSVRTDTHGWHLMVRGEARPWTSTGGVPLGRATRETAIDHEGIRTLPIDRLAALKLRLITRQMRYEPRDYYDAGFLFDRYNGAVQLRQIEAIAAACKRLRRAGLAEWRAATDEDPILGKVGFDAILEYTERSAASARAKNLAVRRGEGVNQTMLARELRNHAGTHPGDELFLMEELDSLHLACRSADGATVRVGPVRDGAEAARVGAEAGLISQRDVESLEDALEHSRVRNAQPSRDPTVAAPPDGAEQIQDARKKIHNALEDAGVVYLRTRSIEQTANGSKLSRALPQTTSYAARCKAAKVIADLIETGLPGTSHRTTAATELAAQRQVWSNTVNSHDTDNHPLVERIAGIIEQDCGEHLAGKSTAQTRTGESDDIET